MCDDSQAQTHNGSTAQVGEAWRTSGRLLEEESLEGAVEDEKELTRQRGCWLCRQQFRFPLNRKLRGFAKQPL